jgi:glycosyltransferase involved in cell wall biosynthesis
MGAYHTDRIRQSFPGLAEQNILQYRNPGIRRMFYDIPSMIKKYGFDYAHFQYLSPRQINNCKYIVTLHDLMYLERPQDFSTLYTQTRRIFFRRSFMKAFLKTTVSEHSKKTISKYFGTPGSDIHVIPNAANHSFKKHFSSRETASRRIMEKYGLEDFILYVSRIEPRKNHILLLKKYLQLELYKKNIPLVFIGSRSINVPDLDNMLRSLTDEQRKYVHLFSNIPQEDLYDFYGSCRLFVYPSKGEGFGIPPLEAAFCGAPVLCSNVTAMQDFYFFQPYAFYPDDEKEFEEKLIDMINNPVPEDFLKKVSLSVREKYCWLKSAAAFCNILQTATT